MNYQDLSAEAGLVQVWGQVDYPVVQWLVSIGALAALTVSMFGSMFPMPRIAYAMANDGLICRSVLFLVLVLVMKEFEKSTRFWRQASWRMPIKSCIELFKFSELVISINLIDMIAAESSCARLTVTNNLS